jgi:hypothetical protein
MKITLEDITAVELLAVAKVLNNINDEVVTPSNAPVVVSTEEVINEPTGDTMDFDKEGLPWDERIHSSNHKLTAQGVWQRRRGVSDEVYNSVKAELLGKWEAVEPVTVEDNNPHLETTILAPSFEPVQAPVVAPAPVAPAPVASAPVQAFVPVQQVQAPVAAPAPVAPVAPAQSTFETFSSKLQYALANKLIEANYMQGVLNTVNATFGTNYQGMFEMRDNENAMLFVINELAKKGI